MQQQQSSSQSNPTKETDLTNPKEGQTGNEEEETDEENVFASQTNQPSLIDEKARENDKELSDADGSATVEKLEIDNGEQTEEVAPVPPSPKTKHVVAAKDCGDKQAASCEAETKAETDNVA